MSKQRATYEEFCKKRANRSPAVHKITGSVGVYDAYRWLRKNKWFGVTKTVTTKEFLAIVRQVNNLLAEDLIEGNKITFAAGVGSLELRERTKTPYVDRNGKVQYNKNVDWGSTFKLWYNDKEAYENKTLLYYDQGFYINIFYNRGNNYTNHSYVNFAPNQYISKCVAVKGRNGDYKGKLLKQLSTYEYSKLYGMEGS